MPARTSPQETIKDHEKTAMTLDPFLMTLVKHDIEMKRGRTHTLQINVGLLCNQTCTHCHLDAGPHRKENMDSETVNHVLSYAARSHFEVIDITGGAPELNPHIVDLLQGLTPLAPRILIRSNLSALNDGRMQ